MKTTRPTSIAWGLGKVLKDSVDPGFITFVRSPADRGGPTRTDWRWRCRTTLLWRARGCWTRANSLPDAVEGRDEWVAAAKRLA